MVRHSDGRILIAVENNASLSALLESGQCVGTVMPVDVVSFAELNHERKVGVVSPNRKRLEPANIQLCSPSPANGATHESECLEKLFTAFSLETGNGLTDRQVQALKEMITTNADVFALDNTELGHTGLVQRQVDTDDTSPIKQSVRRVPFVFRDKIADMVDEMENLGVIQRSSSAWTSPVVLVPKKDKSYRFCVDYRKLNSVTKKDVYSLPRIDDILDTLSGAKFFSTLDLAAGYWQIALDPETASK